MQCHVCQLIKDFAEVYALFKLYAEFISFTAAFSVFLLEFFCILSTLIKVDHVVGSVSGDTHRFV